MFQDVTVCTKSQKISKPENETDVCCFSLP